MRILGNILWFVFGGFFSALGWILAGCFWCITIVGIPMGLQCFKLSSISMTPFGKEIVYVDAGTNSFLMNLFWILLTGWELAAINCVIGLLLCITIVGIPFGKQFFKIASLALHPFGAVVVQAHVF